MPKVFKYPVKLGSQIIKLPKGAKLLHVRHQSSDYGEGLMLWALVNESQFPVERELLIVPTGHYIHALNPTYVNTLELQDGTVFHAFEIIN